MPPKPKAKSQVRIAPSSSVPIERAVDADVAKLVGQHAGNRLEHLPDSWSLATYALTADDAMKLPAVPDGLVAAVAAAQPCSDDACLDGCPFRGDDGDEARCTLVRVTVGDGVRLPMSPPGLLSGFAAAVYRHLRCRA